MNPFLRWTLVKCHCWTGWRVKGWGMPKTRIKWDEVQSGDDRLVKSFLDSTMSWKLLEKKLVQKRKRRSYYFWIVFIAVYVEWKSFLSRRLCEASFSLMTAFVCSHLDCHRGFFLSVWVLFLVESTAFCSLTCIELILIIFQ